NGRTRSKEAEKQRDRVGEGGLERTRRRERNMGIGEQDEGFVSGVVFR
ncbi:hypothetical protein A2U01_0111565, partial [Trifolium medium]|nr:hypothetical protein [Trifolium medium]